MPRPKRSVEDARLAMEVGQRLLEVRTARRLSQEEFIRKLGSGTQRSLAHYEGGKALLPTSLARLVCEKFDLNFAWLVTGRGTRSQSEMIEDAGARRAEAEARDVLAGIREVIARHTYHQKDFPDSSLGDLLRTALRVSLGRLERDFRERKGSQQFVAFLDDLMGTIKELLGEAVYIRKDVLVAQSKRVAERRRSRMFGRLQRTSRGRRKPS